MKPLPPMTSDSTSMRGEIRKTLLAGLYKFKVITEEKATSGRVGRWEGHFRIQRKTQTRCLRACLSRLVKIGDSARVEGKKDSSAVFPGREATHRVMGMKRDGNDARSEIKVISQTVVLIQGLNTFKSLSVTIYNIPYSEFFFLFYIYWEIH